MLDIKPFLGDDSERKPEIKEPAQPTHYPQRHVLDPSYRERCPNEQLKNQDYFWIEKDVRTHPFPYLFKAVLQPGTVRLATLEAKQGYCHDVNTADGSRRCGLATALMYQCFLDSDITRNGGIDPETNIDFISNPAMQQKARSCKTIIDVPCAPRAPSPPSVCLGFMIGALKAGYDQIFLETGKSGLPMQVLALTDAIRKFEPSAEAFLACYGAHWYFCYTD